MRTLVPAILLAVILAFLLPGVSATVARKLRSRPPLLFSLPLALTAIFCLLAWRLVALSLPLVLLLLAYTLLPTAVMFIQGTQARPATWLDLAGILLLWLPIELNVGARWIPRSAQGFLHTVAYGIALTLALALFLSFRGMKGMKYNLPRRFFDFTDPAVAFVVVAPVLILLGLALAFLPPFHVPGNLAARGVAKTFALILAATALPEEILFRALIQNWLAQKFGSTTRVLVAASIIFGCAHLNNGPQALPNWRYMILATIAGFAYGKVFERASSLIAPMILHALVDTTKHVFF